MDMFEIRKPMIFHSDDRLYEDSSPENTTEDGLFFIEVGVNDKAENTQQEGVLHQRPELDIVEEPGEVFKPDPDRSI